LDVFSGRELGYVFSGGNNHLVVDDGGLGDDSLPDREARHDKKKQRNNQQLTLQKSLHCDFVYLMPSSLNSLGVGGRWKRGSEEARAG
jgi:hypothetical protein